MALIKGTALFEETDHADLYIKCRPELPQEIIQRSLSFLHEKVSEPYHLAVDVGCGSGQSTRPLAPYFKKVIGVDVSEAQIAKARCADNPPNVEFRVGHGESIPLPSDSTDFVMCAVAIHWFDVDAFFRDVDRILKPQGCLAIFTYHILQPWLEGDDAKNEQMGRLITEMTLELRQDCTLASYLGCLRSYSSFQAYLRNNPDGPDPLDKVQERLMEILCVDTPPEDTKIQMGGPVVLLLGRKPDNNL